MLDPLGNERKYGLLKTAMDVGAVRQQLFAGNIANVDTPGYKAKDLDFHAIMRDYEDQVEMTPKTKPDGTPFLGRGQLIQYGDYQIEDDDSSITMRVDGNNVDMDKEMAKLAHNSGRFSLATQLLNRKAKLLTELMR